MDKCNLCNYDVGYIYIYVFTIQMKQNNERATQEIILNFREQYPPTGKARKDITLAIDFFYGEMWDEVVEECINE